MKKFVIAIPALLFLLFTLQLSAQTKSMKGSDKARKNLEACRSVNNAIISGDMKALDNVLAENAVDHAGMHGDLMGREAIKNELVKIHSMISDMKMDVVKELADDEYVFQWLRFMGTTKTADMGMPAGTMFDMTAIEVTKFADGKAVEHWEFMQPSDMMKMMGGQHEMQPVDSTMNK